MKKTAQILPSLLAGDFGQLRESASRAAQAGADELHMDIMDANFVHNLSMGPDVVKMARDSVEIPLNVHLMMMYPAEFLERFVKAGADTLVIHIESRCDVPACLERIRNLGVRPGISLNPETPVHLLLPVLDMVDEILFMSVHPGFGGQSFMSEVPPKILAVHTHLKHALDKGLNPERIPDLAVDGGIDLETVVEVASCGANKLIAGTSLYRSADMAGDLCSMREKAQEALDNLLVSGG